MNYFVGIDGGGSGVRVVVTQANLVVAGEAVGATVNPNLIGLEVAKQTIHSTVVQALAAANLTARDVVAVGAGIAGADSRHSEKWVREVVSDILPYALVYPSSDHEIALVGSHGQRRGILILSGTGSLASGVGSSGHYIVIGARGYLLGDEGSGYWIGMEGLKAAVRGDDGRGQQTILTDVILKNLNLATVDDLIPWLYRSGKNRTKEIAAFASSVIEMAEQGDPVATAIVSSAADELALAVRTLHFHLRMEQLPIAFAGGLLRSENPLSLRLCELLNLSEIPQRLYPPVIGAVILALTNLS